MALPGWATRQQSVTVRPAPDRVRRPDLDTFLQSLGADGAVARDLDRAADAEMTHITSLSPLTSELAVAYMERLSRPIPSLTPEIGVLIVGRTWWRAIRGASVRPTCPCWARCPR